MTYLSYNITMQLNYVIKKMEPKDRQEVLSMMETFYSSDAVSTNGSIEIFNKDIDNCLDNNPYLEGFVFVVSENIAGYAIIAKSFSTEYGKQCIWMEDLYLKPEYRGKRIIPGFINYITELYSNAIMKLEVEKENRHAIHVYKKSGFKNLPYCEMININTGE